MIRANFPKVVTNWQFEILELLFYAFFRSAAQPPSRKFNARFSSLSYLSSASLHISSGNPISMSFLTLSSTVCSFAKFSVHILAVYSYNFLSYLYCLATSASYGSSKYRMRLSYFVKFKILNWFMHVWFFRIMKKSLARIRPVLLRF